MVGAVYIMHSREGVTCVLRGFLLLSLVNHSTKDRDLGVPVALDLTLALHVTW